MANLKKYNKKRMRGTIHANTNKGEDNGKGFKQTKNSNQSSQQQSQCITNRPNKETLSLCETARHLRSKGENKAATLLLKKALKLQPNNPDIYNQLGATYFAMQAYKDSANCFHASIKANPKNDDIYNNLSVALHKLGEEDEAIKWLNAGLKVNQTNPCLMYNLANALKAKDELQSATILLNSAIKLNPGNADAFNNLGTIKEKQKKIAEAAKYYKKAVEIEPSHADANFNLGNIYHSQGDYKKATYSFHEAINTKKIFPEAYNNLATSLIETGCLEEATECYKIAIKQNPYYAKALNNLGNALDAQGDMATAEKMYIKAITIDPNYSEAIKNLGMTELSRGDYTKGWEHYEHRFNCNEAQEFNLYIPNSKRWNGLNTANLEPLLIICEQGIGDTIQFMRYIQTLKSRGYQTSISCTEKLHSLIKASNIDNFPLSLEQAKERKDGQWIPLLSIPKHLEVNPKNPIAKDPYIKTDLNHREKWQNLLKDYPRPIVGIHWQGNPSIEKGRLSGRSLPLESFGKLTEFPDISLLSLQKGAGSEQIKDCSFQQRFVSCQSQVNETWDFLETAAIIQNCDLIITNDTAIAHLSGGLGQITWLLLHKTPEWRWGLEGTESFWYPSIRIFRQKEHGNWSELMDRVKIALKQHKETNHKKK